MKYLIILLSFLFLSCGPKESDIKNDPDKNVIDQPPLLLKSGDGNKFIVDSYSGGFLYITRFVDLELKIVIYKSSTGTTSQKLTDEEIELIKNQK